MCVVVQAQIGTPSSYAIEQPVPIIKSMSSIRIKCCICLSSFCSKRSNFAFSSVIHPSPSASSQISKIHCADLPSAEIFSEFLGYSSHFFYSSKAESRAYRRRRSRRLKAENKPVLDETMFQQAISQLLPRFTNEELCNLITFQEDPLVCLELFKWASQQPRFKHDALTYHITIKKLGVAKMFEDMDDVVDQLLAVPRIGNESLYNSIVYFFAEARNLTKAVNVFNGMRNSRRVECRPSVRTYNILFAAMLSRRRNSYVNHIFMETIRHLFKLMVNDGIDPDIFSLNFMIKGYVLSFHVNDALRLFHQMGVVYNCLPNSFTYDYLIHGLCAQARTNNAMELANEMKERGFIPSSKTYNSLVNALALNRDVEGALNFVEEMISKHRSIDFITHRTLLDELCRHGKLDDAKRLLMDWHTRGLFDGYTHKKLLFVIEHGPEISNYRDLMQC